MKCVGEPEVDFEKVTKTAIQNPVQLTAALARAATHGCTANAKTLEVPRVFAKYMSDEGFDSPLRNTGKTIELVQGDAESDASSEACDGGDVRLADGDADLAVIDEAWPMLSADAQRAMVEFVRLEVGTVIPLQIE